MSPINESKQDFIFPDNWEQSPIILVGDIHGKFQTLKDKIEAINISDCVIIAVGDIGIGFGNKQQTETLIEALDVWFQNRNILFLGIAGNHDHRSGYFDGSINLSNFKLLQDYTYATIQGKRWGFVGGAISIDRCDRVKNVSYWEDEAFILREDLIQPCDVLVTHSVPWWLGPYDKQGIKYWLDKEKSTNKYNHNKPFYPDFYDKDLWEECKKERQDISELIRLSKCKQSYAGHMHLFAQVEQGGCLARIIDILEFVEYREFIP